MLNQMHITIGISTSGSIVFANKFKINSYRKEEIEKLNNNKDIILENKN